MSDGVKTGRVCEGIGWTAGRGWTRHATRSGVHYCVVIIPVNARLDLETHTLQQCWYRFASVRPHVLHPCSKNVLLPALKIKFFRSSYAFSFMMNVSKLSTYRFSYLYYTGWRKSPYILLQRFYNARLYYVKKSNI